MSHTRAMAKKRSAGPSFRATRSYRRSNSALWKLKKEKDRAKSKAEKKALTLKLNASKAVDLRKSKKKTR